MHRAGDFGLSVKDIEYDIAKTVKRSRDAANRLSAGVKHLLKKNKVTVFDGHGRLDGPGKVAVSDGANDTASLTAKNIILAPGARARDLPGLEADGELVWNYKEAMVPETMPLSLLVVGSGAIGMEFAQFLRDHGRRRHRGRNPAHHSARRGRRNLGLRAQGFRGPGHQDSHWRLGHLVAEGGEERHRRHRHRRRQDHQPDRRPGHPGGRHYRQCGEPGPRGQQGRGRPRPYGDR